MHNSQEDTHEILELPRKPGRTGLLSARTGDTQDRLWRCLMCRRQ